MPEEAQPFYTPLSGNHRTGAPIQEVQQSAPVASTPAQSSEKPSRTPHFSPDASANPLVTQFTSKYHSALANAKIGNDDRAREDYSEMLKLYNLIANSPDLHDMNKDIAHFCLQDVYDAISKISDPNVSKMSFTALIGITMLLLLIGGMIVTNPTIVGLITGLVVQSSDRPIWIGGEQAVVITDPTTLYLGSLFALRNKAPITFLATSSSTLDAVVSGDYVTLVPKYGFKGTTRIMLIAAPSENPSAVTKVPVDVTVAGRD